MHLFGTRASSSSKKMTPTATTTIKACQWLQDLSAKRCYVYIRSVRSATKAPFSGGCKARNFVLVGTRVEQHVPTSICRDAILGQGLWRERQRVSMTRAEQQTRPRTCLTTPAPARPRPTGPTLTRRDLATAINSSNGTGIKCNLDPRDCHRSISPAWTQNFAGAGLDVRHYFLGVEQKLKRPCNALR